MTDETPQPAGDWKGFALFLLKLGAYPAGLAPFGLTIFWLRRQLH